MLNPPLAPPVVPGGYITRRDDSGALIISLAGRLDVSAVTRLSPELDRFLVREKPGRLVVDLGHVEFMDDFGVALLVGLKKDMASWRGLFELAGVSDSIASLLSLHRFNTLGVEERVAPRRRVDLFSRLGHRVLLGLNDASYVLSFLGDTCFSSLKILRRPGSLRMGDMVENMRKVGVDALPIVALISFLLGLIMAFMSSVQLQQFGANIYVASLVGLSMTRELGPIMTAIIVAGRSGSAFAAEIGSMKISEEIDALHTMGLDPHLFLVMPRLIAALLVVPFLTLFSDVFAILGGLLVGVSMLDLTINGYINQTINTLDLFDVFWGFGKSAVFAILIAWTGCLRGFQVEGGAEGVGRATTSAVVTGIFLIILSDSLLVVILRYWE